MSNKLGDQPALPCPRYVNADGETHCLSEKPGEHGMSLRAYIATQALAGLMAYSQPDQTDSSEWDYPALASDCVRAADALLAELERER